MPDYERVKELLIEALAELGGEPAPVETSAFKITVNKANARCVYDYNKVGHPILGIYPKGGEPKERIQWLQGKVIPVYSDVVIADGGLRAYMTVDLAPNGTQLYVRNEDGVLV
jgi:hypothetical protein